MQEYLKIDDLDFIERLFKPFHTSSFDGISIDEFQLGCKILKEGSDDEKISMVYAMYTFGKSST